MRGGPQTVEQARTLPKADLPALGGKAPDVRIDTDRALIRPAPEAKRSPAWWELAGLAIAAAALIVLVAHE